MSSKSLQLAAPAALFAAALWGVSAAVAFAAPGGTQEIVETPHYAVVKSLQAVAELTTLVVLVGLRHLHSAALGRWGRFGFAAAIVGTAFHVPAHVLRVFADSGGLLIGSLGLAGVIPWLVGFPILGVVVARSRLLPAWSGWVLVAYIPLAVVTYLALASYPLGGAWSTVVWLLVGAVLLGSRAPAREPVLSGG
jgi:hypothetical protein